VYGVNNLDLRVGQQFEIRAVSYWISIEPPASKTPSSFRHLYDIDEAQPADCLV
jgi:hypothetical protein